MSDTVSSPSDLMLRRLPSTNSTFPWYIDCFFSNQGSLLYTIIYAMNIIILIPSCIYILHHGFQDWKRRRSSSSAASISHSDCFTYNMVTMELIGVFGCFVVLFGIYKKNYSLIQYGYYPFNFNFCGQALFHTLTCIERYLAVMHPIIYVILKQEKGVRIRNVLIGCVWLLCCGFITLLVNGKITSIIAFSILESTILVISFCSLSVLCALIRPGPGDKKKVDQSKLKAFLMIVVILVTLVLRLTVGLSAAVFYLSGTERDCVSMTFDFWLYLPSSLVLPLLLLHRAGKLKCRTCTRRKNEKKQGHNTDR